ncbi:MAG: hypothetical protein U0694_00210 [Anaerolineae bacterium]
MCLQILPVGIWITDENGVYPLTSNRGGREIWSGAKYVGIDQYGDYKGWWSTRGWIHPDEWGAAAPFKGGITQRGD